MPVIHTHVSVSTTPEQREALKAAYGRAITAVPGKSEGWLMCPFEDNMPIYFGGSDDQPAAYVEVNVFGRSVPSSAWGEADTRHHGRIELYAWRPRGPHLHPLHRHHRLGLERRQLLVVISWPPEGELSNAVRLRGSGLPWHSPQSASLPTRPQITGSLSFAFLLQTAPPGCLLNVSTSKRGFET